MGTINLDFIRQRRKQLKINQLEIGAVLGLGSAQAYSPYEKGKADFKAEHLPRLCEALGCKIDDLYHDGVLPDDKSVDALVKEIKKRWTT